MTIEVFPFQSIYAVTKSGLEALGQALNREYEKEEIRTTTFVQGVALGKHGGQSVESAAEVHLFIVTRPRGQRAAAPGRRPASTIAVRRRRAGLRRFSRPWDHSIRQSVYRASTIWAISDGST